jgi:type IV pilus assembly protein PilA
MKTYLRTMQKGFTLIELMIVIAIVGILATVALPAYQTYASKAKFSEVILATSVVKVAVELCFQDQGTVDNCTAGVNGVPADLGASGYLSTLTTANGIITATAVGTSAAAASGLKGENYVLTPSYTNGKITWAVEGTCLSKYCK